MYFEIESSHYNVISCFLNFYFYGCFIYSLSNKVLLINNLRIKSNQLIMKFDYLA